MGSWFGLLDSFEWLARPAEWAAGYSFTCLADWLAACPLGKLLVPAVSRARPPAPQQILIGLSLSTADNISSFFREHQDETKQQKKGNLALMVFFNGVSILLRWIEIGRKRVGSPQRERGSSREKNVA